MDLAALQQQMQEGFRAEAGDLLVELDAAMLELESKPQDAALLNRVFRAIHTIKGSGATAGFGAIASFTHHVEELFDEARMGRLTITPAMIDLALQARDLIGRMLESENDPGVEAEAAAVVEALRRILPGQDVAAPAVKPSPRGAPETWRHRVAFKPHPQVFSSGTEPVNLIEELRSLGDATVVARLEGIPPLDSLNPEHCYVAWEVELVGTHPVARINELFAFVEDEAEIRIVSERVPAEADPRETFLEVAAQSIEAIGVFLEQLRSEAAPDPACTKNYLRVLKIFQTAASRFGQDEPRAVIEAQIASLETAIAAKAVPGEAEQCHLAAGLERLRTMLQSWQAPGQPVSAVTSGTAAATPVAARGASIDSGPAPAPSGGPAAGTIRVAQAKLDRLMRSAGELLVARNTFPLLARKLTIEHRLSGIAKEVKDAGDHISHIAEDLHAAVLSIRMTPVRSVFQRFPRLVRDICRAQQKEAQLLLEGEDTELDKTVVEQIADPLVHLVRNAVDHGIEPPEVRTQRGKPRVGQLNLKAYNKGSNVVIEVRDDGAGMNPARLKQKAVDKGLLSADAALAMDDHAALELIFLPGLSTAEKLTDISGRGVGMDVVRSNIRQLHGTVAIDSQPGVGSTVTITLPASLMVARGILVEAAREEYVFPIECVVQTLKLPRDQIHRHRQSVFATFRNQVFPVLRLAEHFGARAGSDGVGWPEEVPVAIVETERGRVGVVVDRFVDNVEVIVKPLGKDFAQLDVFQGATIMGDGRIALVINPARLV